MKKKILITGALGFIGSALCRELSSGFKVVGADNRKSNPVSSDVSFETADLTDSASIHAICGKYAPDIVIHCAGIAHQKVGAVDAGAYMRVNSEATEELAKAAAGFNPEVCFIFLSSVSVYGEKGRETGDGGREAGGGRQETGDGRGETGDGRLEGGECWPSSDYAVSKLDAERRLIGLLDAGILCKLAILRLAPVYDREWSLNLERRVFAPGKMAYLRFGTGVQRMSALARPNLVEFIAHLIGENWPPQYHLPELRGRQTHTDAHRRPGRKKDEDNLCNRRNLRMNVCDAESYEFNRIIDVFKNSGVHPKRPVVSIPLSLVWLTTRVAGAFFPDKKGWLHSCYDKLACDLVFDNGRMMGMGFVPRHSLEMVIGRRKRRRETGDGRRGEGRREAGGRRTETGDGRIGDGRKDWEV